MGNGSKQATGRHRAKAAQPPAAGDDFARLVSGLQRQTLRSGRDTFPGPADPSGTYHATLSLPLRGQRRHFTGFPILHCCQRHLAKTTIRCATIRHIAAATLRRKIPTMAVVNCRFIICGRRDRFAAPRPPLTPNTLAPIRPLSGVFDPSDAIPYARFRTLHPAKGIRGAN